VPLAHAPGIDTAGRRAHHPPPADDTPHRAAFGLLPRFGQPANRFLLADVDLRSPIPTHNPSLWALHERLVETELDQLGQTLTSTWYAPRLHASCTWVSRAVKTWPRDCT
jgi:hypothetical protein